MAANSMLYQSSVAFDVHVIIIMVIGDFVRGKIVVMAAHALGLAMSDRSGTPWAIGRHGIAVYPYP